jgi:hypothetical protein
VDGTRDHATYQKLVTRKHYGHVRGAVGIWPSHQRDDTVTASAGLDVQRDMSPPSAPLTFFTFMMLLSPVTNWEPHGVPFAGCCYAMRHGMKVQITTPYRVSQLQRYSMRQHYKCVPTFRYCAVLGGNSLLMLWENQLVPSPRVKKSKRENRVQPELTTQSSFLGLVHNLVL